MTRVFHVFAAAVLVTAAAATVTAEPLINVMDATPAGSWQEREVVTTDANGRESLSVMRFKHLGQEERRGVAHVWIETESQAYRLKGDKRKPSGDRLVMKALVPLSVMQGDIGNVMSNLSKLGEEVIIQNGDAQPMRLSGAGGLMQGAAQAMNLQVSYDFTAAGDEDVSVPAGSFSCARYTGTGQATMDLMVKKMRVESKATLWLSAEVPFGHVRSSSEDVIDGRRQTSESRLVAHGDSGATTAITGEPMEMPSIPNIFGGR